MQLPKLLKSAKLFGVLSRIACMMERLLYNCNNYSRRCSDLFYHVYA